ncbi:MAG: single-stranded DNA-binding protein [Clostridia bacterium]|jgi:single-strand DNA-binding protein|nr:single-stranded DNA-binding protein [Clostridia bacterium]MBQ3867623.1 single-stranded DNA-binding protein [Clostridia bacterium]MBR7061477.1 single-stranded DNA-binding protein [Clostridia bacterium]
MNKVILIGRLARDPELKYTASNTAVCQFTVAVDRRFKSDNQPNADFIPVVAWRQTAEFVSKYFFKGSRIAVTGQIQIRSWDDAEGKKRFATEVIADDVEFVESKRQDSGYGNPAPLPEEPQTNRNSAPSKAEKAPAAQDGGDTYFALNDEDGCPF